MLHTKAKKQIKEIEKELNKEIEKHINHFYEYYDFVKENLKKGNWFSISEICFYMSKEAYKIDVLTDILGTIINLRNEKE